MATKVAKSRGRPPKDPDEVLVRGSIRLTRAQWAKLERLGGSAWLRKKLDAAR